MAARAVGEARLARGRAVSGVGMRSWSDLDRSRPRTGGQHRGSTPSFTARQVRSRKDRRKAVAGASRARRLCPPPPPLLACGPEMRPIPAAVLGAVLAVGIGAARGAPAAPAQPPVAAPEPTWQELSHSAKLSHDAKDFPAYRAQVGRLYDVLSGHPDTVFGMAKAEALLGHPAAALEWLDAYIAMGLVRDVADEPDFASLRKADGFAAVLARLEVNKRPRSRSVRAFTLPEPDLLTEDIAYDPGTGRFFVSSIREAKIVAVSKDGSGARDFVPAGRDAIWGVLALAVDARRRVLWATTAAMPETRATGEISISSTST